MTKFVANPVEIEAVQYVGNFDMDLIDFVDHMEMSLSANGEPPKARLWNAHRGSWIEVNVGDWILKAGPGDFYPCDPETFEKKYQVSSGTPSFKSDLEKLINKYSYEQASKTPDFILASFLTNVLWEWNRACKSRDTWYYGNYDQ